MFNRRGLKIEPCGTPSGKSIKSLIESFTLVLCFLAVRYEKPYASSLAIRNRAQCSQKLYSDQ